MKLSFKNFLGETFMLIPNINFWSDDDPEYAPHKYMFFIGWLWWGWRFYFGKAESKIERFCIKTMHNAYRNEERYVIYDEEIQHYVSWYALDIIYNICYFKGEYDEFVDKSCSGLSELDSHSICASTDIRVSNKKTICGEKCLSWKSVENAERVAAMLEREADARSKDKWEIYNIPLPTHVLS